MRIHNIIFNNFYNFYFFDLIVFTPKLTSNSLLFSFFAYLNAYIFFLYKKTLVSINSYVIFAWTDF